MNSAAISQYTRLGAQTSVEDADPHRLIQLLMEGTLDRIAMVKGHIARNELARKSEPLAGAVAIIAELRRSLDLERGGDIAGNLEQLYDYMERRLLEASTKNDVHILDEVTSLLKEIKSAWDVIRPSAADATAV